MLTKIWGRLCLCTALLLPPQFEAAAKPVTSAERVTIAPPPGFNLAEREERTIVDIFFNGRRVFGAAARYTQTTLRFEDPQALAEALPGLRETGPIARALARRHPTNSDQLCRARGFDGACGYIYPNDVALIFDPDRLRADLFINDRFTYQRDPRARFLPPPTIAPGLISAFDTRTIYDFDRGLYLGAHNLRAVAGRGRYAVRANLFADTDSERRLRSAYLNESGQRHDRSIGLQPQQFGGGLALSRQLLGLRYNSSLNTRLDKTTLSTTALDIAVTRTATVEIRRDGELLDVQQIAPGQRLLDTDRLPRGSYTIDLVIREGAEMRTESRYFTTNSGLPPRDAPQWYVEFGHALPIRSERALVPTAETPVLAFGRQQRMGANWAVGVDGTLTDKILFLEASARFRTERVSGSISALTAGTGTRGLSATGSARLGSWTLHGAVQTLDLGPQAPTYSTAEYNPFPNSFRQASVAAGRAHAKGQYGLRGFYYENGSGRENWLAGPYADFTLLDYDRWRLNLLLRQDWATRRTNSFVGVRLSKALRRPRSRFSNLRASARVDASRSDSRHGSDQRQSVVSELELRGDLGRSRDRKLTGSVRLRHENELGAQLGLALTTPALIAQFEGRHQFQNQNTALLDLRTGFALNRQGLSFTASPRESGAMITVTGPKGSKVALQENGQTRAVTSSGSRGYLPLDPFTIADIGIQPATFQDVSYDQSTERLIVYPGNVMHAVRAVRPVTIMVGQLLRADGRAISNAVLTRRSDVIGVTDADGFFQIDASPGDRVLISATNGDTCDITLPDGPNDGEPFAQIGALICAPL